MLILPPVTYQNMSKKAPKKDGYAMWFKHRTNSNSDEKMATFFREFGHEGKGLYWDIIEILREQPGYKMNQLKRENLHWETRFQGTPEHFDAILSSMLNSGLMASKDGIFFSPGLLKNMEPHDQKSKVNTQISKAYHEKRRAELEAKTNTNNSNGHQTNTERTSNGKHSDTERTSNGDPIRRDKIRLDKIHINSPLQGGDVYMQGSSDMITTSAPNAKLPPPAFEGGGGATQGGYVPPTDEEIAKGRQWFFAICNARYENPKVEWMEKMLSKIFNEDDWRQIFKSILAIEDMTEDEIECLTP